MRPRAGGRADRARDRSRRGLPAQDQPHRSPEPGAPACCGTSGSGNDERQPFAFPFAGRTWTHFHANTNGNVSFAAPETTHWQQRDPWADGTMRSVAAAVDSRSAAGVEAMIAALWAVYGNATISVDYAPERVAITWDAVARN